jgi:hypothetical protein
VSSDSVYAPFCLSVRSPTNTSKVYVVFASTQARLKLGGS